MMNRSVHKILLTVLGLLAIPAAAQAHLTGTGLGPFYDGVTHFFLSPEEIIPVLALALFAGLRGSRTGRLALFVLPGAWFVGGLVGLAMPVAGQFTLLTCCSFLVLGGLLAFDAHFQPKFVALLALLVGIVLGFIDGSGMSEVKLGALGLFGSVASIFILVALAAALVASLRAPWARIVVRVAGSWIVAAGLLLLGWTFHSQNAKRSFEMPAIPQKLLVSNPSKEPRRSSKDGREVGFPTQGATGRKNVGVSFPA